MGLCPSWLSLLTLLSPLLSSTGEWDSGRISLAVRGSIPLGKKAREIEWSFSAGTGVKIQLAEFNGWKSERPDPSDRFKQRLEMYNETLLRIQALELNDSGVYTAQITIFPVTVADQTFLHMIYDILIAQAQTPRRQVNGILGGSVLLSVDPSAGKTVKEIEWSFSAGAGVKIQLAEFKGRKFERPDPSDRFKQRLEMKNETSLRIQALELNDSGVYEARIKLLPAIVEDRAFLLTVYEPVPPPRIWSQLLTSTLEGCNVTLQCQGLGKGNVTISWGKGNPGQELDSGRHQLSPDGRTLHLSLQPSSLNSTYTCTVSNPVDRKIVSFDLQSICQSGDAGTSFSKPGYIVLTFFLLALSLGTAVWCWRINNEKSADTAATPTGPVEESPSDAQYAEILRSPPEGNDQALRHLENNTERSPQKEPLITTIYDQIQKTPENTSEEVT